MSFILYSYFDQSHLLNIPNNLFSNILQVRNVSITNTNLQTLPDDPFGSLDLSNVVMLVFLTQYLVLYTKYLGIWLIILGHVTVISRTSILYLQLIQIFQLIVIIYIVNGLQQDSLHLLLLDNLYAVSLLFIIAILILSVYYLFICTLLYSCSYY